MGVEAPVSERRRWLELLGRLFDAETFERLRDLGVAPGWRALDVGTGAGSVAAWLAREVRPDGSVLATDVEIGHAPASEAGLEVLEHDVLTDDLPAQSFDLIHCRAVLVHVGDPDLALRRMAGWLKPGGVVLVEEPWTDVGLLSEDPVAARVVRALGTSDLDGSFARRLPDALHAAGLEDVHAEGTLRFFAGGSELAAFFRHTLAGAAVSLIADGELGRSEVGDMLARFDDPRRNDCGWPRIVASARKPA